VTSTSVADAASGAARTQATANGRIRNITLPGQLLQRGPSRDGVGVLVQAGRR
jgi:hypothetical protein